jgi:hypothetical protein
MSSRAAPSSTKLIFTPRRRDRRGWGADNGVRSVRLTFERGASLRSCGSRAPPLGHEPQGRLFSHCSNRRVEIGSSSRRDATVQTRRFAALLGPTTMCQMDRSAPTAPPYVARRIKKGSPRRSRRLCVKQHPYAFAASREPSVQREGAVSVAPLGLVIRGSAGPTADAVGYRLSVLRTCDLRGVPLGCRGWPS